MQSTDIVLVQRITRKQNKIDFSVIENTLLNKKNKLTITRNDFKIKASKLIFNELHGYSLNFCGNNILEQAGMPSRIVMEKIDAHNILIFIYYSQNNNEVQRIIETATNTRSIGIDMGKKNTFAIVNNFDEFPILIKGSYMTRLFFEEREEFNIRLQKAIDFLQTYINTKNIKVVYIGNMYKYTPYDIIMEAVKKIKGVKVVVVDESNTSKASFLDNDILSGESSFSGKRITRSQYVSKDGTIFSSDINAAYNIMIKGNPFALYNCEKPKVKTIDYNIDEL